MIYLFFDVDIYKSIVNLEYDKFPARRYYKKVKHGNYEMSRNFATWRPNEEFYLKVKGRKTQIYKVLEQVEYSNCFLVQQIF